MGSGRSFALRGAILLLAHEVHDRGEELLGPIPPDTVRRPVDDDRPAGTERIGHRLRMLDAERIEAPLNDQRLAVPRADLWPDVERPAARSACMRSHSFAFAGWEADRKNWCWSRNSGNRRLSALMV